LQQIEESLPGEEPIDFERSKPLEVLAYRRRPQAGTRHRGDDEKSQLVPHGYACCLEPRPAGRRIEPSLLGQPVNDDGIERSR
jgi:hypothetical protein